MKLTVGQRLNAMIPDDISRLTPGTVLKMVGCPSERTEIVAILGKFVTVISARYGINPAFGNKIIYVDFECEGKKYTIHSGCMRHLEPLEILALRAKNLPKD